MNYITMYFRLAGEVIASAPVPANAPWMPKIGDVISVVHNVDVSPHGGLFGKWEMQKSTVQVTALDFELYYSDGGHSEVRYMITIEPVPNGPA